ncbi:putative BRI1 kinase inhibitor 1 [Ananas comosus]|nr:putative BRI1 kinase inhibitor 1 [Ananas comosus]
MVEPIRVFMSGDKDRRRDLRRGQRPHSFSGHLNPRDKEHSWRKKRRPGGQLSAPASMRTSPTNSGHLSATSLNMSSSDESTMEELQSAIQAAIAHCKNSIAAAKKA